MTDVVHDILYGSLHLISIYDGEKYYSNFCTYDESLASENQKRSKLLSQGYDVETYERLFYKLKEDSIIKSKKAKNIGERAKIAENYMQEKKELAKEHINVEWKS